MKRKTVLLLTLTVAALSLATVVSSAGRRWLSTLPSLFKTAKPQPVGTASTPTPTTTLQGQPDIEQTARTQHGWSSSIVDSIVSGKLVYYDNNGNETSRLTVVIYRKYPDLLRMELSGTGISEVDGVDTLGAWVQTQSSLSAEDARDIRAFLRAFPERLFIERAAGADYRELGRHIEDYQPATPLSPRTDLTSPITYDQVEVQDTIQVQNPEKRTVYYYVDRSNSRVSVLRYPEPDNPTANVSNGDTDLLESRFEFGGWKTINAVLWPFTITHRYGGKVDFRIEVEEVQMNQNLSNSLFQRS